MEEEFKALIFDGNWKNAADTKRLQKYDSQNKGGISLVSRKKFTGWPFCSLDCVDSDLSRGFVSFMFEDLLNTLIPDYSFGRSPLILYPSFVAQNQWIITLSNRDAQTQGNLLTLGSWPNNI